ncbi:hypothetical protein BGX27_005705 [Mortierella sp. AM989]|nr:hypothetical protein BGX27_005705 [Mortierella sp. AM989]
MSPSHGSSNSNTTKGKSPQIYTRRQEKFIAQQLAAPQNWGLLSGLKLEGATNGNKTDLRKVLLMEVNALFLLSLDDKQLKNKIMTMESSWKKAHQEYIKIDDNGPLALSLKANVMKLCHFYDILYPAASKSLKLNPSGTQKPLINMCYKGAGGDEDDDNNEAKSGDAGESENEDEYESGHDSNDGDGIAEVTLPELKGKPQELEPVTKQSTRNVMTGALVERINQRQDWPNPHNRWQHERESQLAIRQTQLATKRLEFEEKRLDMERQHMLYNDDMDRRMKAIHEKITIAGLKKAEAEEEAAKEQLKLKRLEVELKEVEIEQMKARIKAGVDAETVERETHITPIRNNKRKSNTLSEIPVD